MPTARGNTFKTKSLPKMIRMPRARRTAILKALADPRRLELLERIAASACRVSCAEARAAVDISPATLSHHVKELEAVGLIHVEHEGKYIYLTLRTEVWSAFIASLGALTPTHCQDR